jgi:hypothetical protein
MGERWMGRERRDGRKVDGKGEVGWEKGGWEGRGGMGERWLGRERWDGRKVDGKGEVGWKKGGVFLPTLSQHTHFVYAQAIEVEDVLHFYLPEL